MHVSDVQMDLLSRGELPRPDADAALAHIAQCPSCAVRQNDLAAADGEIDRSLRLLDYPVAGADVDVIIRRAKRDRSKSLWRMAAGIAFLATAGVAAAMPGSPIRAWIDRGNAERPNGSRSAAVAPELPQPRTPSAAGISIEASGSVTLVFDANQTAGSITIRFDTGSELRVRAEGGAAGFEVRSEGLRVRNRGSVASYEVMVPATASSVDIRVGDSAVFRKRDEVVVKGPRAELDGSFVISLRKGASTS